MSEPPAGTAGPRRLGGQALEFPETPDPIGPYPRLTEAQISALAAHGTPPAAIPPTGA